jgi:uncharacterized protein
MTWQLRRWLAFPLVLFAIAIPTQAASIRDKAGMFDAEAVKKAEAELTRLERQYDVPVVIETIEALPDHAQIKKEQRQRAIDDLAVERDRQEGSGGIYILMAKEDRIMSHVLVPGWLGRHLGKERRLAIRDAFVGGFRTGDFDGGLLAGVKAVGRELAAAQAEAGGSLRKAEGRRGQPGVGAAPPIRNVPARANAGGSGWMALIGIVVVILAIVFVIRLLGSLFGGGARRYAGPAQGPGPMGGAPGYGGGYGGGGGGGGFFSGLMGGIGGALAGNWLYDRFSGRHGGGMFDNTAYGAPAGPLGGGSPDDNEIVGANDDAGVGGSWGDAGGDAGGGDWGGGGDGGGDWGGGDAGGGDWGGGGGDGGGSW